MFWEKNNYAFAFFISRNLDRAFNSNPHPHPLQPPNPNPTLSNRPQSPPPPQPQPQPQTPKPPNPQTALFLTAESTNDASVATTTGSIVLQIVCLQ